MRSTGAYWDTVDTVLLGRKTYDVGLRSGTTSYPGRMTYVVIRVSSDAVDFVRALWQGEGRGICVMGGSELATGLIEAGLVDKVGCNIHPVLLGSGVPLFRPLSRQLELEMIESRTFKFGCIYVLYRILGAP